MTKLPDFMELFTTLVATPSVSSVDPRHDTSNRAIVDLLAEWFAELGFSIEIMTVNEQPEKVNLIARMGPVDLDGGLVLAGHSDTVPYDVAAWTHDPFTLTERDGALVGLGSADMKCFFPLVIDALRALEPHDLRAPLTILATCDEESTMAGARALVAAEQILGRHALIGEPTGLQPIYQHKGVMMFAIEVRGQAGHSSDPALGNNALDGMVQVMEALMAWRTQLMEEYQDPVFAVPYPTLNLGAIHGGDSPNRICGYCELCIDLRLLPAMDILAVEEMLTVQVAGALRGTGLAHRLRSTMAPVPPMATARDAPIVRLVESLAGEPGSVAFATEAPFFQALGMSTVVIGPGDIAVAHQANEYVQVSRLAPMQRIIESVIQHFCISPP